MSTYCGQSDSYVDPDECFDCDVTNCQHHPEHDSAEQERLLAQFRSSEFAQDALKSMARVFGISDEVAADRLNRLFAHLQRACDEAVKVAVTNAVKARVVQYVDGRMKKMLDELFREAVEEQIVTLEQDEKAMLTTIRERAINRLHEFMSRQERDQRRTCSKTIQQAISVVVDERVKEAIDELTKETIETFNKEAMKKMMAGMAKAIGQDKRLLSLLTE